MPYLLLTLAALFWGGNYVVGHVLVQGVDPILMTEARWEHRNNHVVPVQGWRADRQK